MNLYKRVKLKHSAQPVLNYLGPARYDQPFQRPTEKQWEAYIRYQEEKHIHARFAELFKDVRDTAKPYKNFYTAARDVFADLTYFIRGLINIGTGIINLVKSPVLAYQAYHYAKRDIFSAIGSALSTALTPFMVGFVQVVASPYIAIRSVWRALITLISGAPRLEDSNTVKQIVSELNNGRLNDSVSYNNAFNALYQKAKTNLRRGTPVAGDETKLRGIVNQINMHDPRYNTSPVPAQLKNDLFKFFRESQAARTRPNFYAPQPPRGFQV